MNTLTNTAAKATAPSTGTASANPQAKPEAALRPPVDVVEDATGITLYADLPGVKREDLQIQVEGDQLTLEAGLGLAMPEGLQAAHSEVALARFRRGFTLSKELDASRVSAELAQGVLRVRIPKAEHAQPRRIQVSVA